MKLTSSIKKGGLDTILAYVVVSLPLFYILVFMIATLYHFSVQMYISQAVKETLVMASSYGDMTPQMMEFLLNERLININPDPNDWDIRVNIRPLQANGTIGAYNATDYVPGSRIVEKGDLMGIEVRSRNLSLLGAVSNVGLFGNTGENLNYSAFREEIIRNDPPS